MTLFGQSAWETIGHSLVQFWEVNCSLTEFAHREAVLEIMENDKEAIWLNMPVPFPNKDTKGPVPYLSPGDILIFDKLVVVGIGVGDPKHIDGLERPRISGDEFGAEILRPMLKPYGWKVEIVYFDAKHGYHIDCVVSLLDKGLMGYPKNAILTPWPEELKDWEVIEIDDEEILKGASNNVPIGNKTLVMTEGCPKFVSELEKRGWECMQVPYNTIYNIFGSSIHCLIA